MSAVEWMTSEGTEFPITGGIQAVSWPSLEEIYALLWSGPKWALKFPTNLGFCDLHFTSEV